MARVRFRPNREGIAQLGRTPEMGAFLKQVGETVAARASSLAPVRTGDLAGSMEVHVELRGPRFVARVVATDFKAHWHEFGTSKMARHPFLRPALEQVLPGARIRGGR